MTAAAGVGPGVGASPLLDPHGWRERARGQLYVADLLLASLDQLQRDTPRPGERRVRTLALFGALAYHLGLAVELAAKGAIAAKTAATPPGHHRLLALCQGAGLQLSADEEELVGRLATAVEWWGRYAAPKVTKPGGIPDRLQRLLLPTERHVVAALLHRLGVDVSTPLE